MQQELTRPSGSQLFGSQLQTDILICIDILESTYASEVAKALGTTSQNVARIMRDWEDDGILVTRQRGNVRETRLNPRFSGSKELSALLKVLRRNRTDLLEKAATLRRRPRKRGKDG